MLGIGRLIRARFVFAHVSTTQRPLGTRLSRAVVDKGRERTAGSAAVEAPTPGYGPRGRDDDAA